MDQTSPRSESERAVTTGTCDEHRLLLRLALCQARAQALDPCLVWSRCYHPSFQRRKSRLRGVNDLLEGLSE